MISTHLIEIIGSGDTLGEGVLWRDSDRSVWWTDIQGRRLHCLDWRLKSLQSFTTPERLGSFAFIQDREDLLLAAFESGFALFDPERGTVLWLDRPPELGGNIRLNDGRVDPAGRFWAGSMVERPLLEGERPSARLYMLDGMGRAHTRASGLRISNGLCWSPAGDRIYFADSPTGKMKYAVFDPETTGEIAFEPFATFFGGSPDGAVTDTEGRVWVALWGGGRLACLTPQGQEIRSIDIGVPQPTCPAFGGEKGNLLFVTTARDGLSEESLQASPKSGSLFVYETNVTGVNPVRARLSSGLPALAK